MQAEQEEKRQAMDAIIEHLGLEPGRTFTYEELCEAEKRIAELPEQIDMDEDTEHHFAPHVYARELHIPAGCVLSGKTHATEHLNVMCGDITVVTEDGWKRLTGWHVIKSKPGTMRLGFAHQGTMWITIHPTDETDLKKLEQQLIIPRDIPRPVIEGEGL